MPSAKKEYSKIANEYEKATKRDFRKFVYNPTLNKLLKNVKNKKVLDLGCGEGVSSRLLIKKGASKVVGMDVSKELIEIANSKKHDKIKFIVKDCIKENYHFLEEFDVITAIMFIHYSKSKKEIENLLKNVYKALKNDGTFYIMMANPQSLLGYNDYGIRITAKNKKEGSSVKTELCDFEWNKFCEFTNYYWSEKTYNDLLKKVGFMEIKWFDPIVSSEGIKKMGERFWKKFYELPVYKIIIAKKI